MSVKSYKTCKCYAGVRKAQFMFVKLSVKLLKLAVDSFVRPYVSSLLILYLIIILPRFLG